MDKSQYQNMYHPGGSRYFRSQHDASLFVKEGSPANALEHRWYAMTCKKRITRKNPCDRGSEPLEAAYRRLIPGYTYEVYLKRLGASDGKVDAVQDLETASPVRCDRQTPADAPQEPHAPDAGNGGSGDDGPAPQGPAEGGVPPKDESVPDRIRINVTEKVAKRLSHLFRVAGVDPVIIEHSDKPHELMAVARALCMNWYAREMIGKGKALVVINAPDSLRTDVAVRFRLNTDATANRRGACNDLTQAEVIEACRGLDVVWPDRFSSYSNSELLMALVKVASSVTVLGVFGHLVANSPSSAFNSREVSAWVRPAPGGLILNGYIREEPPVVREFMEYQPGVFAPGVTRLGGGEYVTAESWDHSRVDIFDMITLKHAVNLQSVVDVRDLGDFGLAQTKNNTFLDRALVGTILREVGIVNNIPGPARISAILQTFNARWAEGPALCPPEAFLLDQQESVEHALDAAAKNRHDVARAITQNGNRRNYVDAAAFIAGTLAAWDNRNPWPTVKRALAEEQALLGVFLFLYLFFSEPLAFIMTSVVFALFLQYGERKPQSFALIATAVRGVVWLVAIGYLSLALNIRWETTKPGPLVCVDESNGLLASIGRLALWEDAPSPCPTLAPAAFDADYWLEEFKRGTHGRLRPLTAVFMGQLFAINLAEAHSSYVHGTESVHTIFEVKTKFVACLMGLLIVAAVHVAWNVMVVMCGSPHLACGYRLYFGSFAVPVGCCQDGDTPFAPKPHTPWKNLSLEPERIRGDCRHTALAFRSANKRFLNGSYVIGSMIPYAYGACICNVLAAARRLQVVKPVEEALDAEMRDALIGQLMTYVWEYILYRIRGEESMETDCATYMRVRPHKAALRIQAASNAREAGKEPVYDRITATLFCKYEMYCKASRPRPIVTYESTQLHTGPASRTLTDAAKLAFHEDSRSLVMALCGVTGVPYHRTDMTYTAGLNGPSISRIVGKAVSTAHNALLINGDDSLGIVFGSYGRCFFVEADGVSFEAYQCGPYLRAEGKALIEVMLRFPGTIEHVDRREAIGVVEAQFGLRETSVRLNMREAKGYSTSVVLEEEELTRHSGAGTTSCGNTAATVAMNITPMNQLAQFLENHPESTFAEVRKFAEEAWVTWGERIRHPMTVAVYEHLEQATFCSSMFLPMATMQGERVVVMCPLVSLCVKFGWCMDPLVTDKSYIHWLGETATGLIRFVNVPILGPVIQYMLNITGKSKAARTDVLHREYLQGETLICIPETYCAVANRYGLDVEAVMHKHAELLAIASCTPFGAPGLLYTLVDDWRHWPTVLERDDRFMTGRSLDDTNPHRSETSPPETGFMYSTERETHSALNQAYQRVVREFAPHYKQ